jgi:glycosyltransferase involved in cell wall biosynthesis
MVLPTIVLRNRTMKIAYIAAGAGGMYCGSCIHDNALAAALQKLGHDVALIPTYTPLRTDEANVTRAEIFFGGINVYLEQKFSWFRRSHPFIEKMLNSRALLNWAASFSASTDARDLGALTVSVLQGEEGRQQKELAHLVHWLREEYQPDIVQLTNSMFAGFARELKRELRVPVLCAMQGEDIFLEELPEPYKTQALQLLRERAREIDGFIATSHYYAAFMTEYLAVPSEKIHVVKLGINLNGHGQNTSRNGATPFVIGYLARICPEKGLHLLVEAFHLLTQQLGRNAVRLKVAGYLGKRDQKYFDAQLKRIAAWGLQEAFEYHGEVDRQQKIDFLNRLDVFSVPTIYKESKGLSILEAQANGVPVVQPRHGLFPEVLAATQGGILFEPESVESLANAILDLYHDPARRAAFGQQGQAGIRREFSDVKMAEATLEVYRGHLQRSAASAILVC